MNLDKFAFPTNFNLSPTLPLQFHKYDISGVTCIPVRKPAEKKSFDFSGFLSITSGFSLFEISLASPKCEKTSLWRERKMYNGY